MTFLLGKERKDCSNGDGRSIRHTLRTLLIQTKGGMRPKTPAPGPPHYVTGAIQRAAEGMATGRDDQRHHATRQTHDYQREH